MPKRDWLYRRSVLALALLAGSLFLLWWRPVWLVRPVYSLLATAAVPFENMIAWGGFEIAELGEFFRSLSSLKTDNAALTQENLRLRADIARFQTFERENAELRSLLDLEQPTKGKLVMAAVIGRESSGRASKITINRGSLQGVAPGQPVVAEGSVLVGTIETVAPATAIVRLLPDAESLVSASLASSDDQGVVRGEHGLGLLFDLALQTETLQPGEAVVTSGLGDHFPAGLLIGTIDTVQPSADRLFQQAVVVSPLRFDILRFVGVIRESSL